MIDGKIAPGYQGPRPGLDRAAKAARPFARTYADNPSYHGGPVMRSSTVYTIFWAPAGYAYPSGYERLVNRYFRDVAAASGSLSNVFADDTQYYDSTGQIAYDSTYGGTAADTEPYPASGCTLPSDVDNAASLECLTAEQLAAEVKRFADAEGWPNGPNVEFFLYTPHDVGSCVDTNPRDGCSWDTYCAFHNSLFDTDNNEYVWANEPYPNQAQDGGTVQSDCSAGQFPNSPDEFNLDADAADSVISSSSHEYNESITDPLGTGWWVGAEGSAYDGSEIGDLCAYPWAFDPYFDVPGDTDQVINGHHYFTQSEWSNSTATSEDWSGCVLDGEPAVTGATAVGASLSGTVGVWPWDPFGSPTYAFTWERCDPTGAKCKAIATSKGTQNWASYTLQKADDRQTIVLRVTSSASVGTTLSSVPTAAIAGDPFAPLAPSISGSAVVGQTLSGDLGLWFGGILPITSYAYKWLRCDENGASCKPVKSGVAKTTANPVTYGLTTADDKSTLVLEVAATNAIATTTVDSDPSDVVGGEPEGGAPSLSGTASVGQTLTANLDAADWSYTPTTFKVVWTRTLNGKTTTFLTSTVKNGAAAPTYKLAVADDKATIGITVTAGNAAGSSDPATASVGPVTGEPVSTGPPAITGTTRLGQTLTAGAGTWSPAATKYSYQWLRCDASGNDCAVIATVGTTAASVTHKLVAADAGKTLRVQVTASNSAGSSIPAPSNTTVVITS